MTRASPQCPDSLDLESYFLDLHVTSVQRCLPKLTLLSKLQIINLAAHLLDVVLDRSSQSPARSGGVWEVLPVIILQRDIEESFLPLESRKKALHFGLLKRPFQGFAELLQPATGLQLFLDEF